MSTQTSGLYAPYERLIKITVLGKTAEVPENNILLRGFQFVNPNTIPYGRFCWNEECQYCRVVVVGMDGRPRTVLSCKVLVREGMEILWVEQELVLHLKNALNLEMSGEQQVTVPKKREPQQLSGHYRAPGPLLLQHRAQ